MNNALIITILNMSLTGSMVILGLLLLRPLLVRVPRGIAYVLWSVAGFRLVCPITLNSGFSLLPGNAAPIPINIGFQLTPRIDSGIAVLDNAVNALLPAATPQASINPLQLWLFAAEVVWLAGIVVVLAFSVIALLRLKRRLRGAVCTEANLYTVDTLKTPFVLGLFKPRIYVPSDLTDDQRQHILVHERAHIKRGDPLVKAMAFAIVCVHWFNPLVWLAFALMTTDMELSCDERALRTLGADQRTAYSKTLLAVADKQRFPLRHPLAFGESGMKQRVAGALRFGKKPLIIVIVAVVLAVVVGAGFLLNGSGWLNLGGNSIKYPIDIEYPKPETGAGIIRVYKQPIPAMRFVGKKGATDWGEWWANGWFDAIENAAGLDNIKALYEDSDGYLDMYCMTDTGTEAWIGMFVPIDSPVPEGFDYVDFPAGYLGVAWIYGKSSEVWGRVSKVPQALVDAGMSLQRDADGNTWFFDRCVHRFLTEDEKGNIILDYCYFVQA